MLWIDSRRNERFRAWLHSASKPDGYRQTGLIWAEGARLLLSLQQAGIVPRCLVTSASEWEQAGRARADHQTHPLHGFDASVQVYVVSDALARTLFTLEHARPMAAVLALDDGLPQASSPAADKLSRQAIKQPCLLLDGVQDPGNVGTLLRTAAAASCHAVYLRKGCAAAWSPKVLRAAMGAHWQLPVVESLSLDQCLALAHASGLRLLAASPHGSQSLYDTDLAEPFVLLLGAEGQGLSPALQQAATHTISIPQSPAVESLNVAASAAVVLFEALRQRTISS